MVKYYQILTPMSQIQWLRITLYIIGRIVSVVVLGIIGRVAMPDIVMLVILLIIVGVCLAMGLSIAISKPRRRQGLGCIIYSSNSIRYRLNVTPWSSSYRKSSNNKQNYRLRSTTCKNSNPDSNTNNHK
jgi:hypothetical protein